MNYTLDLLLKKIEVSEDKYNVDKIKMAYRIADNAHLGQFRSSGEPYISHPLAVAYIVLEFGMDTDTVCAALLHDVVEDTHISLDELRKKFGAAVATLVDGVTKIGMVPLINLEEQGGKDSNKTGKHFIITKEEEQAENIRKILIAMSKDLRVIVIKLADRLHNMRTLEFRRPEKQRATSLETMNFYASIAHRLGMNDVKEEMEAIAIRYLDPFGYKSIEEHISLKKEERDSFIELIKERIGERIACIHPRPIIEGRVKGIYSIYKKIYIDGKTFDEIYDVYAVRIIVQTSAECYNVLGIIHNMFRPMPYRFKDYISSPKPNRYQSLHTTVIGREGIPFEVQIRTYDMHLTALYGIAAHWKYKAGISDQFPVEARIAWINQILEQQQEADDIEQIAETIRTDLAPDEVHVFTPKGDVVTLPLGSTVVDFAYSIHTQIGNTMVGAKICSRITSLEQELKTGDIVEIITDSKRSEGPNISWSEIARTNEAKAKIRAWHKRENRENNIVLGRRMLDSEFKKHRIPMDEEFISALAQRQRFLHSDDFYAAIGYRGVSLVKIMQRVKYEYEKSYKNSPPLNVSNIITKNIHKKQLSGVSVEGIENCEVKYSQCCNPLPNDEIIGFITKGHGISIHKKDCPNVLSNMNRNLSSERWVSVSWNEGNSYYRVTIDIIAEDRTALIVDIAAVISENKLSIIEINAHSLKNGNANVIITIEVAGIAELEGILMKLKKISGVISAERTGKQ